MQNCPVKCSFTVRLGRLNNGKCRPIKLFFRSPIERDAASFFLSGNLNTIKSSYPTFNFSHDRTKLELAQKKRYNALKEELNQKVTAGESGWKIKDGKGGLELVKISSFRGENSSQIPRKQLWNNNFLVLYTNADTLSNKVEELQSLMSVHKPHVVVVTESLPKNCAHPEAYFQQVEGYTLLVNTNYKRGIFFYVHSLLKYTEVNDPLVLSISECLVVGVKFPRSTNSIRIVAVYRSPSVNELSPNNNANLLQYLHNVFNSWLKGISGGLF